MKKRGGSFKKGHEVPIEWRKIVGEKNKGEHHSIKTEFKKGSKVKVMELNNLRSKLL